LVELDLVTAIAIIWVAMQNFALLQLIFTSYKTLKN
jgi:hypothetical protein